MQLFRSSRNHQHRRSVKVKMPHHKDLYGRQRLFNVIQCLHESCPWSKSVSSEVMLNFLESEIKELREELDIIKKKNDKYHSGTTTNVKEEEKEEKKSNHYISVGGDDDDTTANNKEALISEVGDIIFDVLMLEMAVRREYGIQDAEEVIWQVAAEKVERRTPYVKEWGDGISIANTVADTERIWQQVKQNEKDLAANNNKAKVVDTAAANSSNNTTTTKNNGQSSSSLSTLESSNMSNGKRWPRRQPSSFSLVPRLLLTKEHGTIIGTATLAFTLGMFVSRIMIKRGL